MVACLHSGEVVDLSSLRNIERVRILYLYIVAL